MINKKRLLYPAMLAVLSCGALAIALHAENSTDNPPPPQAHHGPPPMPLFDALDTNHDGVISADEIANASTALKALLKNGATQITREDVRPPRPARAEREGDEARPRPHPGEDAMRAHRPPPRDARDADEATPPRHHEADADNRADWFRHGPPPPFFGREEREDRWDREDRGDRAPRPARREEADMPNDGPRRHPRMDDNADNDRPRHPRMDDNADNDRPRHRHPMGSPLFDALDTNHDGVISADEIANAPESLKKLDRTGSGKIERKDLFAAPPAPQDKKPEDKPPQDKQPQDQKPEDKQPQGQP